MASDYRVSPAVTVRFLGAVLVLVGLFVVGVVAAVALLNLPAAVLTAAVVLSVVAVVALGFLANRAGVLVRLDSTGYQVSYLRKAGVKAARWADVEDVVSGFASGQPVVEIRLRDGRTTTIPVNLLAGSAESFALDLREHLNKR